MKKILVAIDGSKPSLDAAHLGLELAEATGASLTLAYSVVPMMLPGEVPFSVVNDVLKSEVARGKDLLETAVKELGAPATMTVQLQGAAAEQIAHLAEQENYDLVVVGSRGRNAVARLFVGSTADRLVHICKKPVLVVR